MTVLNQSAVELIKKSIRDVPDFPKPGILFKDITTLISDPKVFQLTIDILIEKYKNQTIDFIAVPESRGFIFGAPMALALGAGLTLIRKSNKLPAKKLSKSYALEYGMDTLYIHEDAFAAKLDKAMNKANVLIVDDLLATGGSSKASTELIRDQNANVIGAAFVVELEFLSGRQKLEEIGVDVFSIVQY